MNMLTNFDFHTGLTWVQSHVNGDLVRMNTVETKATSLKSVPFETSTMGRHYVIHPIRFADAKIVVMTSHLESLVQHGAERKKTILGNS